MYVDIKKVLEEYFTKNANSFAISFAFLFGSYARGNVHEESDIDIALYLEKDLSSDEQFSLITPISGDLEKIVRKEINIIIINHDFDKPMLYYNAVVLGIPLYALREDDLYKLRFNAIVHMEDFLLFGLRWHIEVAKRNLGGA